MKEANDFAYEIEHFTEKQLIVDPEDSSAGFEDYMRRLQVVLAQREEVLQKAEAELKEEKEAREKRVDKINVPTKKKAARVSS
jgi:hypothetical protein